MSCCESVVTGVQSMLRPNRSRSRFPAKRVEIDGIVFASKKEARRYQQLKFLEMGGKVADIEVHPSYRMEINGQHYCSYTPDFRYRDLERGCIVVEEVKSSGTRKDAAYRLRRKACELFHGIEVVEVIL